MSGDRLLARIVLRAAGWLAPLVVLTGVGAAATLWLPTVLGRALDRVVTGADASTELLQTCGLLGVVLLVQTITQLVSGTGMAASAGNLRRDLIRHVLGAGPALAQRTAEGDLVARLVGSSAQASRVVSLTATLATTLIPPIGGVVALALIDPWLAVTFVVGMVVVSRSVRSYLREARAATTGYLEAQGSIAARLVDALAGARTIAAARTADRETTRVLSPLDALRQHGETTWRNMARLAFQGEPVVLLTQVAVVAVAGLGLSEGRLTAGEMLAASRYAVMAAGIGSMLDKLGALARIRAATQRIADVYGQPVAAYGTQPLPAGPGELVLRDVVAGQGERPVLDGLDLVIPPGRMVALVGRSGAGKSLTAALAGRLCDPLAGQVLLDGIPLEELERRALRRAITYAFDRPVLLGDTVTNAIAFGVDTPRPEAIRRAAGAAHAHGFVGRLPGGYLATLADTPMSGGELQRLGLARAIAHDTRVLILDDATSSLDTATEAEIAAALTAQMSGRTRLIVTHRASTAARADLVAWLDGGRIRAYGPHQELWFDPSYRAIFRPDTGSQAASTTVATTTDPSPTATATATARTAASGDAA